MAHVIEHASSGRAKCRSCDQPIAKGELRFGERQPNAFGEGEMKPREQMKPGTYYEYNDVRINRFALSLLRTFDRMRHFCLV